MPLLKSKFQGTGCNTVVAVAVAIAVSVVTVIIFSQSLSLIIILELKLNLSACACLAQHPKQQWHSTEIPCKCSVTLSNPILKLPSSFASLAINVAEHRLAAQCSQLISDLCRIFWVRHRFCVHSMDNTARPRKGACIVSAWNALTHTHGHRHRQRHIPSHRCTATIRSAKLLCNRTVYQNAPVTPTPRGMAGHMLLQLNASA